MTGQIYLLFHMGKSIILYNTLYYYNNRQLMRSLGEAGEIEPETASILAEYEIDDEEFPKEITDSLPSTSGSQWEIPEVGEH